MAAYDIEGMADRLVVGWQLDHGWTPRSILVEYYGSLARRSRTASEADGCRQARDTVSGPGFLRFVYDLARQSMLSLKDLIVLFKDARVVKFFSKIKWDMGVLFGLLKNGYRDFKGIIEAFRDYVNESGIGKWTAKQLDSKTMREIDEWLKNHPKTRRLTGIAMAGVLVYMWFNMSFMGDPMFDFDLSDVLASLSGSFNLSNMFSGVNGAKLLVLFLTGSLVGITFPWPGPASAKFIVSIVFTLARKLGKKMSRAKESPEVEAEALGAEWARMTEE